MQSIIKNKKALNEIISTIFIIGLAMLTLTTVFYTVKSLTKQVKFSPEQLCLSQPLKITSACYNQQTKDLQITVSRLNLKQAEITQFFFIVKNEKESSSWNCGNCGNCKILESGEKTYFISQETKPSEVSILLDACLLDSKIVSDC